MKSLLIAIVCLLAIHACASNWFEGKSVLVTGGCQGIGYSTAMKFAQSGAMVTIVCRNSTKGRAAENKINQHPLVRKASGRVVYFQADIKDPLQADAMVDFAVSRFGTLDIAVNNAGISGHMAPIDEIPVSNFFSEHDALYNNIYGTMFSIAAEIRYWKRINKEGCIVNTASGNGHSGTPLGSMYGTSKWAVVSLTKSAALENMVATDTTPYIRVNAISPGLVSTPFTFNQYWYFQGKQPYEGDYDILSPDDPNWLSIKDAWVEQLPMKRISEPEEQADGVLFLCSPAASYMSGAVINPDGGSAANRA
ncbi:hypothetical protein P9112_009489 [Eukaryota sp. TZLM1-RC]